LKPLWSQPVLREGTNHEGRRALVKALGDACLQHGPNLLRQAAESYSPTARLAEAATITDMYIDGLMRNPTHPLITEVGQHLHDSSLLPRPGQAYGAAFQAVMHPESGTGADADTVILCQLQAMQVRSADLQTVIKRLLTS
jgi:hypothetical protein